jgi:two-component system LytT family response regulator
MTRRVVIADDEPLARERIRQMLRARSDYAVAAECGDGPEAVAAIGEHRPDLLFLDVRMPGLDGFDVLAALDALDTPAAVIFVTAFSEHAVRAFDVDAVDYLMKPFDDERFAQALERAEARIAGSAVVDAGVREYLAALQRERRYPERFAVRGPRHIYFVAAADVEWVDVASNYVRLHAGGHGHLVRETLSAFGEKLHPDRFVRVHRSAIVRIDQIVRIEPFERGEYRITLRDGTRLTTSAAYRDRLRALVR